MVDLHGDLLFPKWTGVPTTEEACSLPLTDCGSPASWADLPIDVEQYWTADGERPVCACAGPRRRR